MQLQATNICYFVLFPLILSFELILISGGDKHKNFYVLAICNIFNPNFMYMHYYLNNCLKFLYRSIF
jgi:hypothetical protein